jgi:putative tryptophan/tyrosine transport system substrate-binding protein
MHQIKSAQSQALVKAMRRREFITGITGAAAAGPFAAFAQQPAMPVIGLLGAATPSDLTPYVSAFRHGLRDAGYVEGDNVMIEARWANNQYERLPGMAAELVQRRVTVIVAFSTPAAHAAKAATTTIPIVFTTNRHPVEIGLVASLSRPGGNMTGATNLGVEVEPKLLELLHDVVPSAKIIALLVNPTNFNTDTLVRSLQPAARTFGLQVHVLEASTEGDFDTAFATLRQMRSDGLVVVGDVFLTSRSRELAALTIRHAVPAIFQGREFTAAGGLMSYTGSIPDEYRQAGVYTGRILKGEKPAELPVVQGTKFELVINLKTAKALGLNVPTGLLNAADEVIE